MAKVIKETFRALSGRSGSSDTGSARGSFAGPEDPDHRIPDSDECRDRAALTSEQIKAARARAGVAPAAK
jgi:hypothetical protein